MASTTTHSPIDTRSVPSASTPTTPSVTPRPAHRTAAWILAGMVAVAAVSVAAGIGYRVHESSQSSATDVGFVSVSRSDPAESAHGSAGAIRTGAGLLVSGTAGPVGTGVTVVPQFDSSLLAHGTRGSLADASGHPLGVTR
jgi:hypothetical protein